MWDFHVKEVWYIGTAPLHNQCYTTEHEAVSICSVHDAAKLDFKSFSNVNRPLRQQLLGAVKDTF